MILARELVNEQFLNLSEKYDFMSRWVGVYDKYAKLLKTTPDAVIKEMSEKIPESENDKVDLTNKHLELQALLTEYSQKLKRSRLYSETIGLTNAHTVRHNCFSSLQMNIKSKRFTGTAEDQKAANSIIDQTGNYMMSKITTRADMTASIIGYISILQLEKNNKSVQLLNISSRITELENANNLYVDLDTKRGTVKEQKGLSASQLCKVCNEQLVQLYALVNSMFFYYDNEQFSAFADELNGVTESYQLVINKRNAEAKRKKDERKGIKLLPVINN
ncbi:DUF6261 family protein [Phocaeicola sp.]